MVRKHETHGYRFGERRTRELLSVHELEEWQVDAIAHDMALEWDRVLDGLTEAIVGALLTQRLTPRQARQRIRALMKS